jgi:hypothetical protein
MAYVALPNPKKNSLSTTVAAPGINDTDATIPVSELSVFYDDASNLILEGIVISRNNATESATEEIKITGASGTSGAGNLTGATRGVSAHGTNGAAASWIAGTLISVQFTSTIMQRIKDNFAAHESDKAPLASPTFTGTATIPTLDTGVAAAGVTLAGTTLAADGTDENINITITPKGTGSVVVSKADINGGAVDGATIGAASASTAVVTTLKVTTDAAAGKVLVSDADGDLVYTLPKRTLFLSGAGGKASTTNGSGGKQTLEMSTNKVCFTGEKFVADASDKYCEWGIPMPDNWNLSTIAAEFYFMTTSADASDHTIIFGLQAVAFSDGDTGDAAYGTAQEVTETIGSSIANKVIKTAATSAITVGGTPAKGDDVQFRVYRKGSDTFTGDVVLTRVRISYGTNNHSDE